MKNQDVKNEYVRIEKSLEEGINSVDIGKKSTPVASEISYFDPRVDLENDCLDIFVTLENDACYLIEVTTPKFFYTLVEKFKSDFVPPSYPDIIVSKLTDDIIRAAIQEFIDTKEGSYWLKLYHMTATLKIEDINEILDRKEKNNELEVEIEAEN